MTDKYIEISQQAAEASGFVPTDGKIFVGCDYGSGDMSCEVKGYFKDGILHIQEIKYIEPVSPQPTKNEPNEQG
jgi:hypothetical protein